MPVETVTQFQGIGISESSLIFEVAVSWNKAKSVKTKDITNMKNYNAERLIARYQEKPISIGKIAEEFNLCKVTASKIRKVSNIKLWSRQDLNIGELKFDYFKNVDTEIKAYLLGLFAADGCIYSSNCSKLFYHSNEL